MVHAPALVAFTIIEVVVVVVLVLIFAGLLYFLYRKVTTTKVRTVTGRFQTAPGVVPIGGSATFTYIVQTSTTGGSDFAVRGRELRFRVSPSALTVNPTEGETGQDGTLSVVVSAPLNFEGEGQLVVTDVASDSEDPPVRFRVQ